MKGNIIAPIAIPKRQGRVIAPVLPHIATKMNVQNSPQKMRPIKSTYGWKITNPAAVTFQCAELNVLKYEPNVVVGTGSVYGKVNDCCEPFCPSDEFAI
jgi:hypothetical protein